MIKKVHKLKIDLQVSDYRLPKGAEIVQFCEDGQGDLCIWYVFQVNPICEPTYVQRQLHVFGTDHPIPIGMMFVATAICGRFVWHLFEGEARDLATLKL